MRWPWQRARERYEAVCLDCGELLSVRDLGVHNLAALAMAHRGVCSLRPAPHELPAVEVALPDPALVAIAKQYRERTLGLCPYCSGLHLRAGVGCPRVKRITGQPLPESLVEIEFWEDGHYDASGTTWPEELAAIDIPTEDAS